MRSGRADAGPAKPALPKDRQQKLSERIDALNPKLRGAIESLDRIGSAEKGVTPPDPKKLADELLGLVREFPDSSDRLWAYYERAAVFLDHYVRLVRKLPKLDERELEVLEKRFNAKAVAHNLARLGISLFAERPVRPDPRGLDPLSFGHKLSKLGRSVTARLSGWYRKHGGRVDRGPTPDPNESLGFRVGTLRVGQVCERTVKRIEGMRCRSDERRCRSLKRQAAAFAAAVRACLKVWLELNQAVAAGVDKNEKRKVADRLRRCHNEMVELRAALPSGGN